MIKEMNLLISPADADSAYAIMEGIREELSLKPKHYIQYELLKKSIDARQKEIKFLLRLRVFIDEPKMVKSMYTYDGQPVHHKDEVHIIGAGPAGLFCALTLIELGLKPVIFERGKNVRDRRRDLALLNKEGMLNEESNYCFGEGGAGTYSDGKLYTRSKKRGDVEKVLQQFVFFGASDQILYEAHPHIGTNKLPHIIEAIREKIIAFGGEIHFGKKLTDIHYTGDQITSIEINKNEKVDIQQLILATGHSADDVYKLLHHRKIQIEKKPFALGVRIEHPQYIIDEAQYRCMVRDEHLPPASYSLVDQVNQRGVFSFCMCPGGIIAPASTRQGQLVVNGWSPSKRNNPYANSGMVVSVDEKDFPEQSPLAGLSYQADVEKKAFQMGGGKFVAPAQRMTDFISKKISSHLPECSYIPGVKSELLSDVLPQPIYSALQQGFKTFGKKMKGYYTEEAIIVATESRTSSPVRIPRDKQTLQHVQIRNLFPCAEGAGYAGGIVSAAMDGMQIAQSIAYEKRIVTSKK